MHRCARRLATFVLSVLLLTMVRPASGQTATGACCFSLGDGYCEIMTQAECAAYPLSYSYLGDGSTCGPNACGVPTRACCLPDGTCRDVTVQQCFDIIDVMGDGVVGTPGSTCAGTVCPVGACCFPDGHCEQVFSQFACDNVGGSFQGNGTSCSPNPCPQPPTGACCLPDLSCVEVSAVDCNTQAGTYQGDSTTCTPNPCITDCNNNGVDDATDLSSGTSQDCNHNLIPDECDIANGEFDWNLNGVPDRCEATLGDLNCSGVVNNFDIGPFVLALIGDSTYQASFPNCNFYNAEVDLNGDVNFDDIDPFCGLLQPSQTDPGCLTGSTFTPGTPTVRFFFSLTGPSAGAPPELAAQTNAALDTSSGTGRAYLWAKVSGSAGHRWNGLGLNLHTTGNARIVGLNLFNPLDDGDMPRWDRVHAPTPSNATFVAMNMVAVITPGLPARVNAADPYANTTSNTMLLGWVDLSGSGSVFLGVTEMGITRATGVPSTDAVYFGFGDSPVRGTDFGACSTVADLGVAASTDSDGDGTPDSTDGCPLDPLKIAPGICGCGTADTDTDSDGTPNCNDGCPLDPLKIAAGACGCGTADTDTDSDGTPNCNDGCPLDPLKIAAGACGCGVADTDTDSDGTPNCNDGCPLDPLKIAPVTWYADADGDTYGNATSTTVACSQPGGYVADATDCDDTRATVHPGATEVCGNSIDDDCDGQTDEGCCPMSFGSAANYAAGANPSFVGIGDFDGDGSPDLAVTNLNGANVSILLGNANGTFGTALDYGAGAAPRAVAVADFNLDGSSDLAIPNSYSGNTSILLGNGDGTFQAALTYGSFTVSYSVAIGDFNADGRPDLALPSSGTNTVLVARGNGDGTFQAAVPYSVGANPVSVVVADLDGDAYPDLAVGNSGGTTVSILSGSANGTFQAALGYAAGTGPGAIATGSFNADARTDLAVIDATGHLLVLLADPLVSGAFQAPVSYAAGADPAQVTVADFNGDNRPDLAAANWSGYVSILLGNPNGTFQPAVNVSGGGNATAGAAADFNRDGRPDLVTSNFYGVGACVRLNSSPGTTWYADLDADGYGDPDNIRIACVQPPGYLASAGDCDDTDAAIHPGATELCNSLDDNCDGQTDEGLGQTWYADTDADGYGDSASTIIACTQPSGYVAAAGDGCPLDPLKIAPGVCGCGTSDTDTDHDGTANCNDGCPLDPLKIAAGACGCGVADTDTDHDGTPNCHDGCPLDPLKIAPGVCGCGVADTDTDHDGTANCNDGCPLDPLKTTPGICGCGVAETDTDHDGTPNCLDLCPNDPNKVFPGACGCGVAETDTDHDGTPNCHDGCPLDPLKTAPGACGCGVTDNDRDRDGVADCNDGCPDDPNRSAPANCGCGTQRTTMGSLTSWGYNGSGLVSSTPTGGAFIAIAASVDSSVALRSNRSLVGWGSNGGVGLVTGVPTGNNFIAVSMGRSHGLALRSNGTLASWGNNGYSEVVNTPTGNTFVGIAAGGSHSFAVLANGSLVGWGDNPLNVVSGKPAGNNYLAVATGLYHGLALRANGSLISWGGNSSGVVSSTPAGTDFVAVAAGLNHSLALRANGTVAAWGYDSSGQVSGRPTGTGFVAIAAGENHSIAIRADGSLVSWGDNSFGAVSSTPSGTGYFAVAGGGNHTVALRSANTVAPPNPGINDVNQNALLAPVGVTAFNNAAATTDGPAHLCTPTSTACLPVDGLVHRDLWYTFIAPADGTYTISVCDASFDARLALYSQTGASLLPSRLLAASDDYQGLNPMVLLTTTAGARSTIRVGAATASAGGAASLVIAPVSASTERLAMSFDNAGTGSTLIPGVGTVENEDVVEYDTSTGLWSMLFDGSDVGLTGTANTTVDALAILPGGDLLLSFKAPINLTGMTGGPAGVGLDDSDIVRFHPTSVGANTAGSWIFYFDGSDVGLDTDDEDVDALMVDQNGDLLISTLGKNNLFTTVPGTDDEDLSRFHPTSLGGITGGSWSVYFNGSDVGLFTTADEDLDAAALVLPGQFLLSTLGNYDVPVSVTMRGVDEEILRFTFSSPIQPTQGAFSLRMSLAAAGIDPAANLNALEYRLLPPTNPAQPKVYLFVFENPTSVPTLGTVQNEDVVSYNPATNAFRMVFDGSAITRINALGQTVGTSDLSPLAIDALAVLPNDDLLFSFTTDLTNLQVVGLLGLPTGTVIDDSDIIRFTPAPGGLGAAPRGSFSLYFRGSLAALTPSDNAKDVDGLAVLPDGSLLFSIFGAGAVGPVLGVEDEDLLRFVPTGIGAATAGTWSMYFDGSDIHLDTSAAEDVDAVAVDQGDLLLSTLGPTAFNVPVNSASVNPTLTGTLSDLLAFHPTATGASTAGTSSLRLALASIGIPNGANLSALDYVPNPIAGTSFSTAPPFVCDADFNLDGTLDESDFFQFLDAYFAGDADQDGLDGTDSQDFFQFLDRFFQGCP